MKKLFHAALIGLLIGNLFAIFFSLLYSDTFMPVNPYSFMGRIYVSHLHPALIMLLASSIWMMIGLLFELSSRIFHKDWSLLRATLTHYAITFLGFVPLAYLAGWFPMGLGFFLSFWLEFSGIYLAVYFISMYKAGQQITHINSKLQR